ncbi:9670_t:CDS:1, partial [Racocetra persica]
YDPTPQIYQHNNISTLPPGHRAHEMPDKIILWIQELQNYLENIYILFGDELADAECELNAVDFEIFCESLHNRIKHALRGFVKWIETWIHLPLSICWLGGENRPDFARAFLKVFFNKDSSKISTPKEISYVKLLKEDLSNRRSTTFGLLEALSHYDFFEEFENFANSDNAELAKFSLIHEFIKFR